MNILEFDKSPPFSHNFTSKKAKSRTCNHTTVIGLSYLRFIELLVALEKSLILSVPGDLKLIATLITKPTNLSHIQSELQNDT